MNLNIGFNNLNICSKEKPHFYNFGNKIKSILDFKNILFAGFLSIAPASNAEANNISYVNINGNNGLSSSIYDYAIDNGFLFSKEVSNSIVNNLVTITTKKGNRTGIFVTPNRVLTTKHGNELINGTWSITKTLDGKTIKPTEGDTIFLMPHQEYDLSVIDYGDGLKRDYYKYVNNKQYNGKIMFIGVVEGKLILSIGRADNCNQTLNELAIDKNKHESILGKLKKVSNNTECASGQAFNGMSGGMVLDEKGNLFGVITGGDEKGLPYVLYHPVSMVLKNAKVNRIQLD